MGEALKLILWQYLCYSQLRGPDLALPVATEAGASAQGRGADTSPLGGSLPWEGKDYTGAAILKAWDLWPHFRAGRRKRGERGAGEGSHSY